MGRPPSNGGPSFRFNQAEVTEMEAILQAHHTAMPAREVLVSLADKFSASPERSGKITVHMKQVWNWFQNRRYALRAKAAKSPGKLPMQRDMSAIYRNAPQVPPQSLPASSATVATLPQAPQHPTASSGRSGSENSQMEFEAKSARDGAWYDVATFLSHRSLETGDPEVLVRFAGFGPEEDEWVVVRKHVRQRSLPCESSECVAVLPGDLILCFQEGKEQALYFDAHVLDAQRRRHDVRGCRCRFLVRYDHDQSEEIVALRKICRRPETDYRLQQLHALNESTNGNPNKNGANIHVGSSLRVYPPVEVTQKQQNAEPADNLPQATEIKAQLKAEAAVVHSPSGVKVPEASEGKAKQKVEPAVPAPLQTDMPAASEGNSLQKVEPVLPAPADTNLIDVSEGKSQQKLETVVPSSSITNMPEAMESKAQQDVEPAVPAPSHTNMPEAMECKAQQKVEPAVPGPPDTNMPEAMVGEAQQKEEPVVLDPSDTNVPKATDIEVQNNVDFVVQLPSCANTPEVKSLQPDTEMANVQEVGEVKAQQQPEVEMLDADKLSNSNVPPDSTAEVSDVAPTTDTDQEMQEAS